MLSSRQVATQGLSFPLTPVAAAVQGLIAALQEEARQRSTGGGPDRSDTVRQRRQVDRDEFELEQHLEAAGKAGRRIYQPPPPPAALPEQQQTAQPAPAPPEEKGDLGHPSAAPPVELPPPAPVVEAVAAAPARDPRQDRDEEELLVRLLLTSSLARQDSEDDELAMVLAVAEID